MFIGRFYHTLEKKGRVSLPKQFRNRADAAEQSWIVTRGFEGGLFMFPAETFEQRLAELADRTFTKKRDRDFLRLMANDAQLVEIDAQGRMLLPSHLIDQAGLDPATHREVVIVGSYQYLEIWESSRYHDYLDQLDQNAEKIAESIEIENI